MNLVKHFFIIVLGLMSAVQSHSQTSTTPDLNKSLIPPSPDAASLGKYGIVPVTLYEGMPNTSVPVYEIKSGRLSLPISLGYNYNGYRPGEEASWVGLGWALQAPGVITRMVKGLVDGTGTSAGSEWKAYANILDVANDPDFLVRVAQREIDTEPDIYIFNFNGHSGKFILVGDRAFTFPHQDLKISKVGDFFSIIAEDGVTYNFYNKETTTPQNSTTPGNFVPEYTSAWNLTTIISADHTDQISFQYTEWSHRQYNYIVSEIYHQQVGGVQGNATCQGGNGSCDSWSESQYPGAYISAQRLTRIISKNCVVDFIPEATQRMDLNSTTAFALKEIKVFSLPDTTLLRKMELVHDYFAYNAHLKLAALNLTGYYGNNASGTPNIFLPGYYNFEYANENTGAFPKSTRAIDKWGYYNGKETNQSLFDADFLGYPPVRPPGDRTVDSTKNINGILTKLTYPTGGYTTFDYEPNQLRIPGQQPYHTNHVSSLTIPYNGINNPTVGSRPLILDEEQTISYTLTRQIPYWWVHNYVPVLKIYTPGNDDTPPIPPTLIYQSPYMGPSDTVRTETAVIPAGTYFYTVSCESTAINSGVTIHYTKLVTPPQEQTIPGPGLRIKEIKSYDSVHLNLPALVKTYSYSAAIPLSIEGYGFTSTLHEQAQPGCILTSYEENVYTSNSSSSVSSLVTNQFYYPKVTEINHDSIGSGKTVYEYAGDGFSALGVNLVKQSDYVYNPANNTSILLKQKTNTYTTSTPVNFWGFTNNLSHVVDPPPPNCFIGALPPQSLLDPVERTKVYHATGYALTSDCAQLSATDEISYDPDGTNPMTIHTDYYYDNINYTQPSRTVVLNSRGETITTQIKYPYDCAATSTCYFPGFQETAFKTKRDEASTAYQDCTSERYSHALPYWNPNIRNSQNTALINALNAYPCENNYPAIFASALAGIGNLPCPGQGGYGDIGTTLMQANHIVNTPVEQIVSVNRGGTEYLFAANRTKFASGGGYRVSPETLYQTGFTSTNTLKSDYLANPLNYLQARVNFVSDVNNNIVEQSKINDVKMAYIWDYKNNHAIAQVTNADKDNIAYTSFEADGKGRFSFSGVIQTEAAAPSGKKVYLLNSGGEITISTDAGKMYTISLWAKNNGVAVNGAGPLRTGRTIGLWSYYEYQVSNASGITISGNTSIDELRLYPKESLMTTYTYDPLTGLTSQCDANNHFSYYEYDALGRLLLVRNEDRHITRQYEYHYDRWSDDTQPNWITTGLTQCKPCPANSNYLSNILQQQEHDINPQSPTYNQYRWVDAGPSPICDANAAWQNVSPAQYRCVLNPFTNQNTGQQEQQQQDMNPCSYSYQQYRWFNIGTNTTACPLPSSCPNCTGVDKKCINNICETGIRVYTSSVYNPKSGLWTCTYHFHWSDGSNSQDYTETSDSNCMSGTDFENIDPPGGEG